VNQDTIDKELDKELDILKIETLKGMVENNDVD